MNSGDGRDPTLMLVIAAFVALLLIQRTLSRVDPGVISSDALPALPLLVGLVGALLALLAARSIATRRALRRRVRIVVVPADEFDPSVEAVVRFAAQLARVRRRLRGWLTRPASAVRVRLETDPAGRLAYLLEVPGHAEAIVRAALRSFDGVELRDPDAIVPAHPALKRPRRARAELVLARPSVEPLARLELDPDPLGPFAAAGRLLDAAGGERLTVCIDLLPAAGSERRRWRRRLMREARRTQGSAGLLEALRGERRRGPSDLVEQAERREAGRALDAKLKDAGALFALQVVARCEAAERARAKAGIEGLLAAFEPFADRNWLRVAGLPLPGLGFLGADLPWRRGRLDRRIETGRFRPARRNVVTAREAAGLLKPPTVHCTDEAVVRSGPLVPAAPALPAFDHQRELIPLGRVASDGEERLAGVRIADTFFSYCAGRSRFGKTELAVGQFLHLVRSGHGGFFLDPHEDAIEKIKLHLTAAGLRERVVEINLAPGAGSERQPGWNLFDLGARDATAAEARVEAIVDAFASALRWEERNARALNLTTQAAQALAAIARVLPAELRPTIFQLPTLLSDDDWRRACLRHLPVASQRFWLDRFPRLAEEAITPVTNLVDRLRASTAISALLGQSRASYRAREAMDRGQIVLACPGAGGTRDRLIANLLVFDLLHAAKGRADLAPERRRPFFVFLDEVQTYDGASSGNLAALLEQSAKYGIRAFLLNQNPERLTPATLNAVTTNRSHLLATALNARAAALLTKEWGGRPEPAALTGLPRYRFLAQVTDRGEASKPFLVRGASVEELFGSGDPNGAEELGRAVDATAGRRPASEVTAALDTLDARILRELRRRAGEREADPGPSGSSSGPFDVGSAR